MYLYEKNVFGLQTAFFDSFTVLLSFLAENDTERIWNYLQKQIVDPKRAKFDQQPPFG